MIQYQRVTLANGQLVGEPGPLPDCLVGLEDISLADLSWVDPALGFSGQGFNPVEVADPVTPPAPVVEVDALGFRQLFTAAERIAIRTAAKTNAQVDDWLDLASVATVVRLNYETTVTGVHALEAAGIIGAGRAAIILSGTQPA